MSTSLTSDGMDASELRSQPLLRPTSSLGRWELAKSSPGVVVEGVTERFWPGAKETGAKAAGTKELGVEGAQATDGNSKEEGGMARQRGSIAAAAVAVEGGTTRPGGVSGSASEVKFSRVGRNESVAS